MSSSLIIKVQHKLSAFDLDVDLALCSHSVTAIFGPSGSGKTSVLRCVAGLERPKNALIKLEGECWQDDDTFIPTHKRPVAYVFQEASVFPNLTVKENLEFAHKRRVSSGYSYSVKDVLQLCQIDSLVGRISARLSGGEQQRVAIAQSLLRCPKLLLLDEPISALDTENKSTLLALLERLKREVSIPILYVSHSILEVSRIADEVVVLQKGKVQRRGSVGEVTRQEWYKDVGEEPGVVLETNIIDVSREWKMVKARFGHEHLWVSDNGFSVNDTMRVFIAAKDVSLTASRHEDTSILNILQGSIVSIVDGDDMSVLIQLNVSDNLILAKVTKRSVAKLNLDVGGQVWLQIKAVSVMF